MNWVVRAAERILGVPAPASQKTAPIAPVIPRWDQLSSTIAAINERLTGQPDLHPATRVLCEQGPIETCLVLADNSRLANALQDVGTNLTIHSSNQLDWSRETTPIGKPLALADRQIDGCPPAFDAAFIEIDAATSRDWEQFFKKVRQNLTPQGRLWLHFAPSQGDAEVCCPHQQVLIERLLREVPARWRLTEGCKPFDQTTRLASLGVRPYAEAALRAYFQIDATTTYGGALLGPLFAHGCIDPAINDDDEGRLLVAALYRTEQDLIESGELLCDNVIYLCRPRPPDAGHVTRLFEQHAGPAPEAALAGMAGSLEPWLEFNLTSALTSARAADYAAPFPPAELMYRTTGLQKNRDFAQHGADIISALSGASPYPLNTFGTVLDFGVGVGRVARYFKGFAGRYIGLDIDPDNLRWIAETMPWVDAVRSKPNAAIPIGSGLVDAAISISVFTHIDEATTAFYIDELHRLLRPDGIALLTLHGERALQRGLDDTTVARLMGIEAGRLEQAKATLEQTGFDFIEQYTHLTQDNYCYGTTFISRRKAEKLFSRRFTVLNFVPGAIHSFQDLIVLKRA